MKDPQTNEFMMHTLQRFWKNEDITDTPLAWRDTGLKSSQDGVDSLQVLSMRKRKAEEFKSWYRTCIFFIKKVIFKQGVISVLTSEESSAFFWPAQLQPFGNKKKTYFLLHLWKGFEMAKTSMMCPLSVKMIGLNKRTKWSWQPPKPNTVFDCTRPPIWMDVL